MRQPFPGYFVNKGDFHSNGQTLLQEGFDMPFGKYKQISEQALGCLIFMC